MRAPVNFSSKEKTQALIGMEYGKLIEEKKTFLNTLKQEWIKKAEEKGLYDPESKKGRVLKTSYN